MLFADVTRHFAVFKYYCEVPSSYCYALCTIIILTSLLIIIVIVIIFVLSFVEVKIILLEFCDFPIPDYNR